MRRRAEAGLGERLAAPEAALLRGMVLGADERLSEEVKDDFQASGLAHILAVSGQNVMLLVVLILAACALVGVPYTVRIALAAAVVALYVPLTGAGPSIQRAGVMGIAGLVAALAGRPGQRWYALLLAAAVTLALNPRAPEEPGWQLSFVAVAALLAGAPPLRAAFARRMPGPVADAAAITTAATLGTAPLMALHFQQVSLAALPANLLAAPAIAPVMWLGVLASTVAQVTPALAAPFTALTGPLLVYIQQVAHHTAGLPLATIEVQAGLPVILAAWAALVGAVAIGLRRWGHRPRRRRRRRTAVAMALTAAVTAATVAHARRGAAPPAPGVLRVTFLDVGQGDATLIQLDGVSVLVDTGVPDGPILARLRQAGVDRLDALMLTHAESDHEGAAPQVIAAPPPAPDRRRRRGLGLAHPARAGRASRRPPRPGAGRDDHARRACTSRSCGRRSAHRGGAPAGDPNDNALVTRLEAEGISMLLTADAESHVLLPLRPEPVDVLKVSHHGSADPGLPALLQRIRPRLAAIEVGAENTYGHPAPSTLAALARGQSHRNPDRPRRHDASSTPTTAASPANDVSVCGHARTAQPRAMVTKPSRQRRAHGVGCTPKSYGFPRGKDSQIVKPRLFKPRDGGARRGRGRGTSRASGAPTTVVIQGVAFRGPTGGNDEYIQIKNISTIAAGHRRLGDLCGSNSTRLRGRARARTIADGVTLPAGKSFLFTNDQPGTRASAGGEYSGSVPGDLTYTHRHRRHRRPAAAQRRRHGDRRRRQHTGRVAAYREGAGLNVPDRERQRRLHPQGAGRTRTTTPTTSPARRRVAPENCGTACAPPDERPVQARPARSRRSRASRRMGAQLGLQRRQRDRPRHRHRHRQPRTAPATTPSTRATRASGSRRPTRTRPRPRRARSSSPASAARRPTRRP